MKRQQIRELTWNCAIGLLSTLETSNFSDLILLHVNETSDLDSDDWCTWKSDIVHVMQKMTKLFFGSGQIVRIAKTTFFLTFNM
jgi:hypothetical protein